VERHAKLTRHDLKHARQYYNSWTPDWARKYLDGARNQVGKCRRFLPHLTGFDRAYEIGVGPGFLLKLLTDVHGVAIRGCDVGPDEALVFHAMHEELGIAELVQVHRVRPRQEIPIVEGSEALLAFKTFFCETYTVADYRWLLDHCRERLSGDKQVILLLNACCFDVDGVQAFFMGRAEFPLLDPNISPSQQHWDNRTFCRVRLA